MKRLLLCLLLSFALLLSACGAPSPEPEVPEAPAPVETAAPEPEPESEPGLVGISMPTEDLHRWKHEGEMMKGQLETLRYKVDLEFARNDPSVQIAQLEDMIANGARVLIISAIDDYALRNVLDTAKEAGVKVIAYDRTIMDSDGVSYYCIYNSWEAGTHQAQYIADALDLANAGDKTYNIELFSGDPGDGIIAHEVYEYAFEVLRPYLDAGTLRVLSGQTERYDCAIGNEEPLKARARLEEILDEYYSDGETLDAVMCSYDSIAQGAIEALEASYQGGTYPIITGWGTGLNALKNIIDGKQSMSVIEYCDDLANAAVEMADAIMQGKEPPVNDTKSYSFDFGIIPAHLVEHRIVTAENWKELLVDTGYYTEEQLAEAGIKLE